MKRRIGTFFVLILMLIICAYVQPAVIYRTNGIDTGEDNRENDINTTQVNQQIIKESIEKIYINIYEIQEIIKEQHDDSDEEKYLELWTEKYVSGITFEGGVTQEDINRIAGLENLRQLEIVVSAENIDLTPLGNLTQLKELTIEFLARGYESDLTFMEHMTELTKVVIMQSDVWDLSLFGNMPYLQELYVEYVQDVDLNYLANCTNLRQLHIVGQNIRNAEGLSNASCLRTIYLFDSYWRNRDKEQIAFNINPFTEIADLEWVLLAHVDITDISPLSDLQALREIYLVDTNIDDIESLSNLPSLSRLEIYGNKSDKVEEQAELFFINAEVVIVTEDIPNEFL